MPELAPSSLPEQEARPAESVLLAGEVPGTWHVKNQFGNWNVIYDENEKVVGLAYWKDDRDKIVSAHNRALALARPVTNLEGQEQDSGGRDA